MSDFKKLIGYIESNSWNAKIICQKLEALHNIDVENDAIVKLLAYVALNEDSTVLSTLQKVITSFQINIQNTNGETALLLLIKRFSAHAKLLPAIIFLLRNDASALIRNNQQQNLLHLLMQHATPLVIQAFWKERSIWDFLLEHRFELDSHDVQGKIPLHYLASREANTIIDHIIAHYYRFAEIDVQDNDGNNILHCAAMSGDEQRVANLLEQITVHSSARLAITATNNAEQTAADIAQQRSHYKVAAMLYQKEFRRTQFVYYVQEYFKRKQRTVSSQELVEQYQEKLLDEFERLLYTVDIPTSEIDDTVIDILKQLGLTPQETSDGLRVIISNQIVESLDVEGRKKLMSLTVVGKMEEDLRELIRRELADYVQNDDGLLKAREEQHDAAMEANAAAYEDEIRDFEDGDEGYDYDGPVRPEFLDIGVFNEEAARKEIDEEFTEDVLTDVGQLLEKINVQQGLLGNMLYNHFIEMDLIDDLIGSIDYQCTQLKPEIVSAILQNIDFQFPDIDITQVGFLLEIFRENFSTEFENVFYQYEISDLVNMVITVLSDDKRYIAAVRSFNAAFATNDALTQQKAWLQLQPLVDLAFEKNKRTTLPEQATVNKKIQKIKQKFEPFTDLVKIFPSNFSDQLVYRDKTNNKEYTLPLRPIFKSLYSIAKATHETIVAAASANSNIKKTNIVTAMFSFFVEVVTPATRQPIKAFVNVPLTFDYPALLLSRDPEDAVFKDDDEFERSVAEDRQFGADIVGRQPTVDVSSKAHEAKAQLSRLLEVFHFPNKAELQQQLAEAEVAKPIMLEYYSKKEVQKTTEFFHSERVVLHALKKPANVQKVLYALSGALQQLTGQSPASLATYNIHTANLLLYSYPNSICDECSLGLIALENSYAQGFLKEFMTLVNQSSGVFKTLNSQQLHLTVVAGSYKIFDNDPSAKHVQGNTNKKLDCYAPTFFAPISGIAITTTRSEPTKAFYEFVESDIQESTQPAVPFAGFVAMSGSKKKKLPSENLEKKLEGTISTYNQSLGM